MVYLLVKLYLNMQEDIVKIYHNKIGICFKWLTPDFDSSGRIQVVFRDMGFYLTEEEIRQFAKQIIISKNYRQSRCSCHRKKDCKNILLDTPASSVSLAVSITELNQLEDLLQGTLFWLELDNYLKYGCKN